MRREEEDTIRPLSTSLHIDNENDVYANEKDEHRKRNQPSTIEMYLIDWLPAFSNSSAVAPETTRRADSGILCCQIAATHPRSSTAIL
jgi:hypothetical protein